MEFASYYHKQIIDNALSNLAYSGAVAEALLDIHIVDNAHACLVALNVKKYLDQIKDRESEK